METASIEASKKIYSQLLNNPFNVANDQIVGVDGTLNPAAKLLYTEDLDWADGIARIGHKQEYSLRRRCNR